MDKALNFTSPQMSMLTSIKSRNLFLSGQGGGKTFVQGALSANLIDISPGHVGLICANTYGQLSASTLKEVFFVWKNYFGLSQFDKGNPTGNFVVDRYPPQDWNWFGKFHEKPKTPHNHIFFKSGALIQTASLDNYKAIDGRTIGWALLDETKDTKKEAVEMVILGRLRQKGLFLKTGYKKKLRELYKKGATANSFADILPFTTEATDENGEENKEQNPLFMFTTPYKELWLLEFFNLLDKSEKIEGDIYSKTNYYVSERKNKKVVIASNWHNEKNLRKGYIQELIEDLPQDLVDLKVYGNPFGKSGNEYAKQFDRKIHVAPVALLPDAMLHFTLDFNVNPYMSGLVIQLEYMHQAGGGGWKGYTDWIDCNVIKEYALTYPKNEAFYLGEEFISDYAHMLNRGFYLYGDASGQNRLGTKDTKTLFADVLKGLGGYRGFAQMRVPKSNPRYAHIGKGMLGRKSFLNVLLAQKKPVRLRINPDCTELINDLAFCTEDANGKLSKKKTNGVELRGHHVQTLEYFICYPKTLGHLAIVRTK